MLLEKRERKLVEGDEEEKKEKGNKVLNTHYLLM
jgi:hypothetical protein